MKPFHWMYTAILLFAFGTAAVLPAHAEPKKRMAVLFLGDSVAGDLNREFRQAFKEPHVISEVQATPRTGLADLREFDSFADVEKKLDKYPETKLVIVHYGANDLTKGIRNPDNSGVIPFSDGADKWLKAYRERVKRMMELILEKSPRGTKVVWMGLPVVEHAKMDEISKEMNRVFQEEAEKLKDKGIRFFPSRDLSAVNGKYAMYKEILEHPDAKEPRKRKIRRRDQWGIHFSEEGSAYILRHLRAFAMKEFPDLAAEINPKSAKPAESPAPAPSPAPPPSPPAPAVTGK